MTEQMLLGHRYRNRLCELELIRRGAFDAMLSRLSPRYAARTEAYAAADLVAKAVAAEIKALSARARAKVRTPPELKARSQTAKATRKTASIMLKATKSVLYTQLSQRQAPFYQQANSLPVDPDMAPATRKRLVTDEYLRLAALQDLDGGQYAYSTAQREARAASGLYWGTYLLVEDACREFGQGAPPKFAKWRGDGTIGVQLMGGLSVADALSGNSTVLRLQLRNEEELAVRGKSRGLRAVGTVFMRVGSNADRSPIFAEVPATFHLALPQRGEIRWAYLHRRRVATHNEWMLRLTINEETPAAGPGTTDLPDRAASVAVHPGWRMRPDGSLRVAVCVGSDGVVSETSMDAKHIERDLLVDQLDSIRDNLLNAVLTKLRDWLRAHVGSLPAWLVEATEAIGQWKSQRRLAGLVLRWRENRFAGDEELWQVPPEGLAPKARHNWHKQHAEQYLESWRKQDKHLYEWQENLRGKLIRKRKDAYRCLAKDLAARYASVAVSDVNWADVLKKEEAEEKKTQTSRQRHLGRMAAPGEMVCCVSERFAGRVTKVSAVLITPECHLCGQVDDFDRREKDHTCSACGQTWDQDVNGAKNQLARAAAMPAAEPAPPKPSKARRNRRAPTRTDEDADGQAIGV